MSSGNQANQPPSPNQDDRPAGAVIDILVLHYTGMADGPEALRRLRHPGAKVSAHYLIDEAGQVIPLVAEERRAWHAGPSEWRGRKQVNDRSIGIELVNPGHAFGYRPFPDAQMEALRRLAAEILARHPIPRRNLVGHSDIAPARKQDPGELFDWPGLARAGIGLWPDDLPARTVPRPSEVIDFLARFGYDTVDSAAALGAFQRHFRPRRVDGLADGETVRRLARLLEMAE